MSSLWDGIRKRKRVKIDVDVRVMATLFAPHTRTKVLSCHTYSNNTQEVKPL